MDHPDFFVSNSVENSIRLKRVNQESDFFWSFEKPLTLSCVVIKTNKFIIIDIRKHLKNLQIQRTTQ